MQAFEPLTISKAFASALDRCDFAEAAIYLSKDCHYQLGQLTLVGPEAIIGSYRDSAAWASRTLDQVIYESEVTQDRDSLSVLYIDRLTHGGQTHEYRCRQHLSLNAAGKIARIVHEELPGEHEMLVAYFAKCGVVR
jgi:hypothetical protein